MLLPVGANLASTLAIGLILLLSPNLQNGGVKVKSDDARFGVSLVKDEPGDRFKTIRYSELPNSLRTQSENYLAMFLSPAALPQNAKDLTTRVFTAQNRQQDDLIELRWTFEGRQLRLIESINAAKLQIEFEKAPWQLQDVKTAIGEIVNTAGVDLYGKPFNIQFQWPDTLSEGTSFSSNPTGDILRLNNWHDRVDAIVNGRSLDLLFYKKVPQLIGYQEGSLWFKKYWGSNQ